MAGDAIGAFELFQPTDREGVLELLVRYGSDAWLLAGGYDSLDWFKDRHRRPGAVIDLDGVAELRGVRETDGWLEIGATTTLTELASDERVRARFPILSQAAERVASPQIRNVATVGGNVSQDARCWYYRYGVNCYRAGGNTCYAAAPDAMNREHAIFGASRCVAVSPSDLAPALVALDARMAIGSARGGRVVPAADFFTPPSIDITRMTALGPLDLLESIRIPPLWSGAPSYFEKVADRETWDFALASVAAAFRMDGDVIDDARVVCGAIQCVPRRFEAVERWLRGRTRSEETAAAAGALAIEGAEPLGFNGYKVPLTESLVKRAVRGA